MPYLKLHLLVPHWIQSLFDDLGSNHCEAVCIFAHGWNPGFPSAAKLSAWHQTSMSVLPKASTKIKTQDKQLCNQQTSTYGSDVPHESMAAIFEPLCRLMYSTEYGLHLNESTLSEYQPRVHFPESSLRKSHPAPCRHQMGRPQLWVTPVRMDFSRIRRNWPPFSLVEIEESKTK